MKNWIEVEEAFQNANIDYEQKEWLFLCQIEGASFYYSPQKQKWRLKGTRVWHYTDSVENFIIEAKEYLQTKAKASTEKSPNSAGKQKKTRKKTKTKAKKKAKTKASNRNYWDKQPAKDLVRVEFLKLFDSHFQIYVKRGYKPAWIWHSLLLLLLVNSIRNLLALYRVQL